MKAIASLATAMLLLAGVGLVACGGDDDDDGSDESAATTTAPAAGTDGDNRINLFTPYGELVFLDKSNLEPATATAEAGDLTIVWENGSDTKHNICLEDEQGNPVKPVFKGPGPRLTRGQVCSKTIRGRTITTQTKVKPGEYTYWCSVDGHREAGMEGTLTVK
jgi:plastocyanin